MEVEPRTAHQPPPDGGGLVRGEVVQDQVQIELGGSVSVDGSQEGQEFLGPMALVALPDDRSVGHVQRGEQVRDPVPPVVVGLPLRQTRSQRQDGLGAVQGLDLGLLVHAEHQGVLGRIEVEAHHVPQLLLEILVAAELEVLHAVRLDPTGLPDTVDGHAADPQLAGQGARGPVGGVRRRAPQGGLDDGADLRIGQGGGAPRAGGVLLDPREAKGQEPSSPEGHRVGLGVKLQGDGIVLGALGGPQDDAGTQDEAVRRGATAGPRGQLSVFFRGEMDRGRHSHEGVWMLKHIILGIRGTPH